MRASTSNILFDNNFVYKIIGNNKYQKYSVYEREVFWLERFHNVDFVPNLIETNDNKLYIKMDFVGTEITKENIPADYNIQLDNISETLKKYNCQHNDINDGNFLVKNNKIYLIDFGWSTFIDNTIENFKGNDYGVISNVNLIFFPKELNQFNLKNNKLDDDYAFDLLKKRMII